MILESLKPLRLKEKKEVMTSIKIGQKFRGQENADIEIIDIWVDNIHMKGPTTWIQYKFSLPNSSKSGIERNTIENFKKNIISKE